MNQKKQEEEQVIYPKPILVFYLSITGIRSEDVEQYVAEISKKIMPNIDAEAIVLAVDGETRVECINPVYILNDDLIKKHERLMAELHEHINYHINKIKNKENE